MLFEQKSPVHKVPVAAGGDKRQLHKRTWQLLDWIGIGANSVKILKFPTIIFRYIQYWAIPSRKGHQPKPFFYTQIIYFSYYYQISKIELVGVCMLSFFESKLFQRICVFQSIFVIFDMFSTKEKSLITNEFTIWKTIVRLNIILLIQHLKII